MLKRSLSILLLTFLSLTVAGTLFLYEMYDYVNSDQSALLLMPPFIAAIGALLLTGTGAFAIIRKKGGWLLIAVATTFALYLISARSLMVNLPKAEISEHLFGIPIRMHKLEGIDDRPYCVDTNFWFLHIRSEQDREGFLYFRGLWPAYLKDKIVDSELKFLGRCQN